MSSDEFVERWAGFVKNNPDKWKKIHTEFIDAQFIKSEEFLKRLANEPEGRKKIIKMFNIENVEGYSGLLVAKDTLLLKKIATPSKEDLIKDLDAIAKKAKKKLQNKGVTEKDLQGK